MEKKNINLYDFLYNYSKEFESLAEKKNIKIKIEKKYDLVIENNSYYLERLF
ncbi:MAG: hypothetical protein P1U46_03425 [Patescibacteria group bacterium]|nr:hypothetical protein [Patescibacteria group bacterium]